MELFCVWTSVAWLINYSLFFCFYSKFKMKETSEIVRGKLEWFFSILNAILVCLQQCNVWNLRIKKNYLLNTSAYRRTNIRFDHRKTTISKFTQMFILNGCNNANGHRLLLMLICFRTTFDFCLKLWRELKLTERASYFLYLRKLDSWH